MSDQPVLLKIDGPVARIVFNRPKVLNALNAALGQTGLQFSNPSGNTLQVAASSASGIAVNSASTTITTTWSSRGSPRSFASPASAARELGRTVARLARVVNAAGSMGGIRPSLSQLDGREPSNPRLLPPHHRMHE